jgi:predicted GNAT family acetyltransferase
VAGRGIANLLTRKAVQCAEASGWKVHPACSYADTWFKRNTEFANLLV